MSSFTRTIQRTLNRKTRAKHYLGRGRNLGVRNPKDKALIARLAREAKRKGN